MHRVGAFAVKLDHPVKAVVEVQVEVKGYQQTPVVPSPLNVTLPLVLHV